MALDLVGLVLECEGQALRLFLSKSSDENGGQRVDRPTEGARGANECRVIGPEVASRPEPVAPRGATSRCISLRRVSPLPPRGLL